MAWMQFHGRSRELGMEITFQALVPQYNEKGNKGPAEKGPYKVIYLLHGLDGNSSSWMRMTAIERRLKHEPVIVIMPETDNMWYVNSATGFKYFEELTKEWPKLLKSWFPVSDKKEDTMIAGFSMGGYGALLAGMTCPDQYGFVGAFAPAVDPTPTYEWEDACWKTDYVFGPKEEYLKSDWNLFNLIDKCSEKGNMPATYVTAGKSDMLLESVQKFVSLAKEKDLPVEYEEVEGEHDWYFAEDAFYRALDRFLKGGN